MHGYGVIHWSMNKPSLNRTDYSSSSSPSARGGGEGAGACESLSYPCWNGDWLDLAQATTTVNL